MFCVPLADVCAGTIFVSIRSTVVDTHRTNTHWCKGKTKLKVVNVLTCPDFPLCKVHSTFTPTVSRFVCSVQRGTIGAGIHAQNLLLLGLLHNPQFQTFVPML